MCHWIHSFLQAIRFKIISTLSPNYKVSRSLTDTFIQICCVVTPVTKRLFGAWTAVAAFVRLQCALNINDAPLYRTTVFTFAVALAIYTYEVFVGQTIPLAKALPAFIVASVSLLWMTVF